MNVGFPAGQDPGDPPDPGGASSPRSGAPALFCRGPCGGGAQLCSVVAAVDQAPLCCRPGREGCPRARLRPPAVPHQLVEFPATVLAARMALWTLRICALRFTGRSLTPADLP